MVKSVSPDEVNGIFKVYFLCYMSWIFPVKLYSDECQLSSVVAGQHWYRSSNQAVRQQAIT